MRYHQVPATISHVASFVTTSAWSGLLFWELDLFTANLKPEVDGLTICWVMSLGRSTGHVPGVEFQAARSSLLAWCPGKLGR